MFTSKSIHTSLAKSFLHPKKALLWRCTGKWYPILFIKSSVCFIIGYCFHISLNFSFGFALRRLVFAQSKHWYLCSLKPLFKVIVGPRNALENLLPYIDMHFQGRFLVMQEAKMTYVWRESRELCMPGHCWLHNQLVDLHLWPGLSQAGCSLCPNKQARLLRWGISTGIPITLFNFFFSPLGKQFVENFFMNPFI